MRRRQSNACSISSDELSSDYTTSDESDSSEDSELLALVDGGCKKNPFTVPQIIVQPNSPIPCFLDPMPHIRLTFATAPLPCSRKFRK